MWAHNEIKDVWIRILVASIVLDFLRKLVPETFYITSK